MRVLIGEDELLFREGLVRLLSDSDFEVVGQAASADELVRKAAAHRPDLVMTDVRMPPENTDDGLRAAIEIRRRLPGTAIFVLSHYVAEATALELMHSGASGIGYLLKDRVYDLPQFLEAIRRVGGGGCALDPQVVQRMLDRADTQPLGDLTAREREVLALMAEGQSNRGIAQQLVVTEHAIEKHVRAILRKLDVPATATAHRRVLAVLRFLQNTAA